MHVLVVAGVGVDPELPVGAAAEAAVIGVVEDMYEMVSVAEEHQQQLLHEQGGFSPACEVIKPECYCIQPPCVQLCIVGMIVIVIAL